MTGQRSQRLRADLTLALVALIWGSAFAVQRATANGVGVFWFTGVRFLLGALVLLPLALRPRPPTDGQEVSRGVREALVCGPKGALSWILLCGGILFIAANLQQLGLRYTTSGNAGFITGLYVVFVPFILVFILRQRLHVSVWAAAALSVGGLLLLSTGGRIQLFTGDAYELAGALFWAAHLVVIGKAVQRVDVLRLAVGQYLVNGLLNLLAGLVFEPAGAAGLAGAWWALLYTGILSVGAGYTLQAVAQRHAPPTDAALILSMEAVFAAVFGYVFLGELLTGLQIAGCGLILAAIVLVQVWKEKEIS